MKSFPKILTLGISIILYFPIKSIAFEVVVFPEKNNSADILTSNNIPYDKYRNQLIQKGWIPSKSENIIDNYPEVACGSTFCSAKFIAPSGTKILSILLSPHNNSRLEFIPGSEDIQDITSKSCY